MWNNYGNRNRNRNRNENESENEVFFDHEISILKNMSNVMWYFSLQILNWRFINYNIPKII